MNDRTINNGPEKENQQLAMLFFSSLLAQMVIDHFKNWLPRATQVHKSRLEAAEQQRQQQLREKLQREREAEEANLRVNRALRV